MLERLSKYSCRRGPRIVSESYSTSSPWRIVQCVISEGCPQLKQTFCFEKMFFILGLGMCEGANEDSRHEIGHVDIQVGSCIFLNVFGCHYICT